MGSSNTPPETSILREVQDSESARKPPLSPALDLIEAMVLTEEERRRLNEVVDMLGAMKTLRESRLEDLKKLPSLPENLLDADGVAAFLAPKDTISSLRVAIQEQVEFIRSLIEMGESLQHTFASSVPLALTDCSDVFAVLRESVRLAEEALIKLKDSFGQRDDSIDNVQWDDVETVIRQNPELFKGLNVLREISQGHLRWIQDENGNVIVCNNHPITLEKLPTSNGTKNPIDQAEEFASKNGAQVLDLGIFNQYFHTDFGGQPGILLEYSNGGFLVTRVEPVPIDAKSVFYSITVPLSV